MSRSLAVFQVDAFTRQRFTGNPAGVVLGADALSDEEMLAIARELNNADTAFVSAPDGADHDLRVRFFTPRTEAAFVAHATVAAHYVMSRRPGPRRLRQKQKAGIVEVEVRGEETRGASQSTSPRRRSGASCCRASGSPCSTHSRSRAAISTAAARCSSVAVRARD